MQRDSLHSTQMMRDISQPPKKRDRPLSVGEQNQLPAMPLPSLRGTCQRYLDIVSPFLTPQARRHTERAVAEFQTGKGVGLQAMLAERAGSTSTSYLHDVYQDIYLKNRLPLPIHQNCAGMMEPMLGTSSVDRSALAAAILVSIADLYLQVKRGELTPDKLGNRLLCMSQYRRLFATTRLPGIDCDTIQTAEFSIHAVVCRHNVYYAVQLICEGAALPAAAVKAQIDWIMRQQKREHAPVGVLTSLPRFQWAKYRQALIDYAPENRHFFTLIDEALCILALDETTPRSNEEAAEQALYGQADNRWFDKSLQLILLPDGRLAANMEHSGVDGTPLVRLGLDLKTQVPKLYAQCRNERAATLEYQPIKLRWQLSPRLCSAVKEEAAQLSHTATACHTRHLALDGFGGRYLANHDLDPDATIQLMLQLAYARLHGKPAMAYEPVQMRHFHYGRTDGMRSSTAAAIKFVRSWHSGSTDEQLWSALTSAVHTHQQQMITCLRGQGVDKHLFALYSLAAVQKGGDLPAIFCDTAYMQQFCQPELVTSSVPSIPGLAFTCFGPLQKPASYSVAYLMHAERVVLTTTSQEQSIDCFVAELRTSFSELRSLIERQSVKEARERPRDV